MSEKTPAELKRDGWQNTITKLGRAGDKRMATSMAEAPVQASREEFDDWYHGDHTSQKIARLPAREMTREGITIKVDDSVDGEEEAKTEASTSDKLITAKQVMQGLDDISCRSVLTEALTWARVHGGSLIYMDVDDGVADLAEPMNEGNIRKLNFLRVYDRWEAIITEAVAEFRDPRHGQPQLYQLYPVAQVALGGVENPIIHASRFVRLDGVLTSKTRMQANSGWGDSVYTAMRQTLADYGISWASVTHLLQDFSQAVFKMQGLAEALLSSEGDLVLERLVQMDLCRSVARAVPIDAESEDFFRAQTPTAGIPEIIDRLMLLVASAAEMPATLLFGQSPAGLNATGASDIRFFYDQVKAKQEETLRPALDRILDVLFASKQGPTNGVEPENWSYEFAPLWQETDGERASTRKTQAEADAIYLADGVLDPEEVAMSRFGGDTYSTDTVLDMEKRAELDKMPEPEELPPPPTPPPVPAPPAGVPRP